MRTILFSLLTASLLTLAAIPALAQQDTAPQKEQGPETVYGWQLMSEQERAAYRTEMHTLETREERKAFREAHRKRLEARAAEQGVTLAEPRPGRSLGQGQGRGRGQGSGKSQPGFDDFDLNGDGYIAADEYGKAHAERVVQRSQEGRRMRNAGQTTFAEIDANRDGKASREEFAKHQAQRRADRQR